MKKGTPIELWVVSQTAPLGQVAGSQCRLRARRVGRDGPGHPGYHTLIREGIASESEAEQLWESPGAALYSRSASRNAC